MKKIVTALIIVLPLVFLIALFAITSVWHPAEHP